MTSVPASNTLLEWKRLIDYRRLRVRHRRQCFQTSKARWITRKMKAPTLGKITTSREHAKCFWLVHPRSDRGCRRLACAWAGGSSTQLNKYLLPGSALRGALGDRSKALCQMTEETQRIFSLFCVFLQPSSSTLCFLRSSRFAYHAHFWLANHHGSWKLLHPTVRCIKKFPLIYHGSRRSGKNPEMLPASRWRTGLVSEFHECAARLQ